MRIHCFWLIVLGNFLFALHAIAEPLLIDFKPTRLTPDDFQPLRTGKSVHERPAEFQGIYGPPSSDDLRFLVIPGQGLAHPGNPDNFHPCRYQIQRRDADGNWREIQASTKSDGFYLECELIIVTAKNDKVVPRGTQGMLIKWQGMQFFPLRAPLPLPGEYPYLSQDPIYMLNAQESPRSKSPSEQRIMLNEIYARHGFIFQPDGEMDQYFRAQPWYKPEQKEVSSQLNPIEKANIKELRALLKPENIAARENYLNFLKAFCTASENDDLAYLKAHVQLPFRVRGDLDYMEAYLKTWDSFLRLRKKLLITQKCYDPHYYDTIGFSSRYNGMSFVEQNGVWTYATLYDDDLYAVLKK